MEHVSEWKRRERHKVALIVVCRFWIFPQMADVEKKLIFKKVRIGAID